MLQEKKLVNLMPVRDVKIRLLPPKPTGNLGKRKPDPIEVQQDFLRKLFFRCSMGYIDIRFISKDGKPIDRDWIPVNDIKISIVRENRNVIFGVATRQYGNGTKEGILQIPAVWVDIDFRDDKKEEEARNLLAPFPLKPSLIVASGGGWHLYWFLKVPATRNDILRIEEINRKLAHYFGGDTAAAEAAHPLRVAGTMNMKYEPPRFVSVESCNIDRCYDLQDFDSLPPSRRNSLVPFKRDHGLDIYRGVPEGQRHNAATRVVGKLSNIKGMQPDLIYPLTAIWNQLNDPPLLEDELNSVVHGIYNKNMRERNKGQNYVTEDDSALVPDLDEVINRSVIDVKDFLEMKLPEREYIISPWLKAGNLVLISAERGIGKTWLVLVIAVAVTRGERIGKWLATKPTGCLIIDGEMAIDEIQSRMRALEKGLVKKRQKPLKLLSSDYMKGNDDPAPNLTQSYWRDNIESYLQKNEDIRLLIIDNVSSLMPGPDENAKQPWDDINQWLLKLRSRGISVITIHHTGKSGDMQRGTSAREDNIDTSIILKRPKGYVQKDGTMFNLEFTKGRTIYGDDAETFCLQIKTDKKGKTTWHEVKQMLEKERSIIKLLGSGDNQKAIADTVECTPAYVSQVKKKAIKNGLVTTKGVLTEKGMEQLGLM